MEDRFMLLPLRSGVRTELSAGAFPIRVSGWSGDDLQLAAGGTHYGMVTGGAVRVSDREGVLSAASGMFFVCPGAALLEGGVSAGLVISCQGYIGLRLCGGPIEQTGRLTYIDGCSDTLLVCPPRLGEPCLNSLHIPPHTRQSAHTHPSVRIGVVLRGSGECRTPQGIYPLEPGMGWLIPPGCVHAFHTLEETLDIIAWHPDSDFGPTDGNHPMLNRTDRYFVASGREELDREELDREGSSPDAG